MDGSHILTGCGACMRLLSPVSRGCRFSLKAVGDGWASAQPPHTSVGCSLGQPPPSMCTYKGSSADRHPQRWCPRVCGDRAGARLSVCQQPLCVRQGRLSRTDQRRPVRGVHFNPQMVSWVRSRVGRPKVSKGLTEAFVTTLTCFPSSEQPDRLSSLITSCVIWSESTDVASFPGMPGGPVRPTWPCGPAGPCRTSRTCGRPLTAATAPPAPQAAANNPRAATLAVADRRLMDPSVHLLASLVVPTTTAIDTPQTAKLRAVCGMSQLEDSLTPSCPAQARVSGR